MVKDELDASKYPEGYKKFIEKEKEIAINFVRDSDSVLDIGCGNGRLIPIIAPLVTRYVGIDIDDEYIKTATNFQKDITM